MEANKNTFEGIKNDAIRNEQQLSNNNKWEQMENIHEFNIPIWWSLFLEGFEIFWKICDQ